MRKLLFVALLATAATPALADDNHAWGRHERNVRAESNEQRPAAPQASQRAFIGRAPEARVMMQQPQQPMGGWAQQGPRGGAWNRGADGARPNVQQVDPSQLARFRERQAFRNSQMSPDGAQRPDAAQEFRRQRLLGQPGMQTNTRWGDHTRTPGDGQRWSRPAYGNGYVQGTRTDGQRWDGNRNGSWSGDRNRDGQHWDGNRNGSWSGDRNHDGQRWGNNWRQNPRYDWRSYRDRNRSVFRIGRFYDPFGYGYQPLSIGFTLFSGYYQPNYWIDDPYEYRLPPVYGPYRWVRYYNDAVLVDIYTGEVEDVIRDFFW